MKPKLCRLMAVSSLVLFLAGCGPKSVSGAYMAAGPQSVELLQITESKDGQLLGALSHFGYKNDGAIERLTMNVTGTTDGQSITLVAKPDTFLAQATNLSGSIGGGTISITSVAGTEKFTRSSADDYQAEVNDLNKQAASLRTEVALRQHDQEVAAQQQAQMEQVNARLLGENNAAVELATRLNDYAAKVQAKHDISSFHEAMQNSSRRRDMIWISRRPSRREVMPLAKSASELIRSDFNSISSTFLGQIPSARPRAIYRSSITRLPAVLATSRRTTWLAARRNARPNSLTRKRRQLLRVNC